MGYVHRGQNKVLGDSLKLELHHLGTELRSSNKEVCILDYWAISPAYILFTYCFCWVGSTEIQNQADSDYFSATKITHNICFKMYALTKLPFQIEPFAFSLLLFLHILSSEINNKHGYNFHFLRIQLHITAQEKSTGLLIWLGILHSLPVK